MNYQFHYGVVFGRADELLLGAWLTIRLTVMSVAIGLPTATACAYLLLWGNRWVRRGILFYVELIRNTPFLVQLFFVFFGLPSLGIRLTSNEAALAAMVINVSAYATEIMRTGFQEVPKGLHEAGFALGLRRPGVFFLIIFRPALRVVFPALASQFVLLLLGSSVVSGIAASELTAAANTINTQTFRSFEVYSIVLFMYLGLAILFRLAFRAVYRLAFERRRAW
jgi:polar amino acid transport system permease protein